mmetsp:Transcript_11559/g.46548  ORF Transcript_11559/g.46548 Transcript_11559/m.46548 type:complete len:302 (-) Transcript_11559:448-1353(-)
MLVEPRAILVPHALQLADVRALLALERLALATDEILLALQRGDANFMRLLGEDKLRAKSPLLRLVDRGARQREPPLHPLTLVVRGVLVGLNRGGAGVEIAKGGAVLPNLLQHGARPLHRHGAEPEAVLGQLAPRPRALESRNLDREGYDSGGLVLIALVTSSLRRGFSLARSLQLRRELLAPRRSRGEVGLEPRRALPRLVRLALRPGFGLLERGGPLVIRAGVVVVTRGPRVPRFGGHRSRGVVLLPSARARRGGWDAAHAVRRGGSESGRRGYSVDPLVVGVDGTSTARGPGRRPLLVP